jgi:long-chain acyl-CoA synthetase
MSTDNDLLLRLKELTEQEPYTIFLETTTHELTRQSFWNASLSVAARIKNALGTSDSNVVGIYENDPGSFFVYLVAVWMIGSRALPLNIRMPEHIIISCIKKSRCKMVIGSAEESPKGIYCAYLPMEQSDEGSTPSFAMPQNESAIIMFTSGSTGEPKAIPLTFHQIIENSRLTIEVTKLNKDDKMLIAIPPYFTSGICHFLTCVLTGAKLIAVTGFNFGEQIIDLINKYNVTAFGGSPTNVRRVLGAVKTGEELSNVRFWVSSGDYLSTEEQQQFLEKFPSVRLIYIYGLSEVGGRLCINDVSRNPCKIGSPGVPLPGMDVIVISEDGKTELGPHEIGELKVTGMLLMDGYLLDNGEINRSSVENGFCTGDLGYVDDDGFIWIVGRTDDVFKIGGEKVSVTNVEDAIRKNTPCRDCCVAIINEQNLGSVLIGLVVPDPKNADINHQALFQKLREELPPNALPAKVYAVDDIPRTGSGKVARQEAKDIAHSLLRP